MCKAALPHRISSTEATIILILNIFLPGVGTMLASVMGRACRCDTLLVGLLQLLTAPLIIGWIWSVWWGVAACGRVGKKRDIDDRDSGKHSSRHTDRHSKHSSKSKHSNHSGGNHSEQRQSNHSSHRSQSEQPSSHHSERVQGQEQAIGQPQQGFPQAYPEPTFPDAAYQQPYPGDYPPTQPPV